MIRQIFTPWIVATSLLTPYGLASAQDASKDNIVIGQSAPLSGAASQLGVEINFGANVYLYQVNRSGGINGRKVELKVLDDRYSPEKTIENTRRFLNDDKVLALLGYVGAPASQAALPLINNARIPFVGAFTGAEFLRTPFNPNVFNVRASYFDEAQAIARHLTTVGLSRIAVFYEDDSNGQAGLAGLERALADNNLKLVATTTVKRSSIDVSDAVREIVRAQPQAVVMMSAYGSSVSLIREIKKLPNRPSLWSVSLVGAQALARELEDDGRGIQISQVVPSPWNKKIPLVREYQAAMADVSGELGFGSLEGYIAAKLTVEGIRRAGRNPTRETVMRSLKSLREYDMGGYTMKFDEGNHNGSSFVELTMLTAHERFIR
jgi:branched-chain amino acid transport system substrate-binding protein